VGIFLGIDGGGSKTCCAIGDETSLLGSGTAEGSNPVRVGEHKARQSLHAAIQAACAAASINAAQIQRTCVGIAGGARPEIAAVVRSLLSDFISSEIQVVGDMVIALEAAHGTGPGVIIIAGTGSIAYGRNSKGQTARAGGWGFAISDEGSGQWIGRTAVTAALRAHDQGQSPALLESLMKALRLSTLEQLILAVNASPPPDFSGLFPAVLSAADTGDATAHAILNQASQELARLAAIVIDRLFPRDAAIPVATSGGVFRNSTLVRQGFYNSLRASHPSIVMNQKIVDPVDGALALARKGFSDKAPGKILA